MVHSLPCPDSGKGTAIVSSEKIAKGLGIIGVFVYVLAGSGPLVRALRAVFRDRTDGPCRFVSAQPMPVQ